MGRRTVRALAVRASRTTSARAAGSTFAAMAFKALLAFGLHGGQFFLLVSGQHGVNLLLEAGTVGFAVLAHLLEVGLALLGERGVDAIQLFLLVSAEPQLSGEFFLHLFPMCLHLGGVHLAAWAFALEAMTAFCALATTMAAGFPFYTGLVLINTGADLAAFGVHLAGNPIGGQRGAGKTGYCDNGSQGDRHKFTWQLHSSDSLS